MPKSECLMTNVGAEARRLSAGFGRQWPRPVAGWPTFRLSMSECFLAASTLTDCAANFTTPVLAGSRAGSAELRVQSKTRPGETEAAKNWEMVERLSLRPQSTLRPC